MLGPVGVIASTVSVSKHNNTGSLSGTRSICSIYMFSPPSDPHFAHFAAGDSHGLLTTKNNVSIGGIGSHLELARSGVLRVRRVRSNAQKSLPEGLMGDGTEDYVRTERPVGAPFATPPV